MNPYYQPVVDAIQAQPHDSLQAVLNLCLAVEAEDGPKAVIASANLVKGFDPNFAPMAILPEGVFLETIARLLLLGEIASAQMIVDWYEYVTVRRTPTERIAQSWAEAFEFVTLPPPGLKENELDRELGRIPKALRFALIEYTIAAKAVKPEKQYFPPLPGELPEGSFGTATFNRPTMLRSFSEGARKLVNRWMAIHQQHLEAALKHLASGGPDRGEKLVNLRRRWLKTLAGIFGNGGDLLSPMIDLTRIKYGLSPNHDYLDTFLPFEARHFGFRPYDRDPQDEPPGKSIWLEDLIVYRTSQLHYLLDQFGIYYLVDENSPARTPAAIREENKRKQRYQERSKLIDKVEKKTRSLSVESDDQLSGFACALFETLTSTGTTTEEDQSKVQYEAWDQVLKLLHSYLRTQTVSPKFNLAERPMYLGRLFPRGINGGALHDCGVYAVRLAYFFLSMAHCLKARVHASFIVLPLHVGLVVEIDGFDPLITHNDTILRLTENGYDEWRKEWDSKADGSDPKDLTRLDQMFLEDVAAQVFARGVDMPIHAVPIRPVSSPPKKDQIWRVYEGRVTPGVRKLFSGTIENPNNNLYQFDLRFLTAMATAKGWYDKAVVPFWNKDCFELWNASNGKPRFSLENLKQQSKRNEYTAVLEKLITAVEKSFTEDVTPVNKALNDELKANKKALLGKFAERVTRSERLSESAAKLGPVGEVREHKDDVAKGNVSVPRFASPSEKITRVGNADGSIE